ncbi:MAG: SagB/ThcOx family dehydrogenase [Dehalococcoidia bacterium]|nr:MAG: SagB/ThcOx family dehydrogenase [Dehalococcoidia bacterium]
MPDDLLERSRYFLKDSIRKTIDFSRTDQSRNRPPPPIAKPYTPDSERIDLLPPHEFNRLPATDLLSAIENRESRRKYSSRPLTHEELSYLLWITQGVKQQLDAGHALRTVPSAGARHALETYLCVLNVSGLDTGFYRYLPLEHQLLVVSRDGQAASQLVRATLNQSWMANAAVIFIWSTIPYRMEWRYGLAAHKVILLDAGHVCQNFYLACEAIGAGTCAVAAYDQEEMDRLLDLDGKDEFAIYMAAVGRIR